MKHILIGVDGTPESDRALERAAELARAVGASVTVASVAPFYHGYGRGIGVVDPVDTPERHEEQALDACARLTQMSVEATAVQRIGDPAQTLAELAQEVGADLIVVGTHEYGALGRLVHGSVSGAVRRKARVDVLIVH
jgi:nucleotide-binding universal stress UspA family protein